jgi:hypothetical protein
MLCGVFASLQKTCFWFLTTGTSGKCDNIADDNGDHFLFEAFQTDIGCFHNPPYLPIEKLLRKLHLEKLTVAHTDQKFSAFCGLSPYFKEPNNAARLSRWTSSLPNCSRPVLILFFDLSPRLPRICLCFSSLLCTKPVYNALLFLQNLNTPGNLAVGAVRKA